MTVYVDDMQLPARVGRINAEWSHMMADSVPELLDFAVRLGLQKRWIQYAWSGVHFDLTEPRRQAALRLGAVEISCGEPEWMRVHEISMSQYQGPLFGKKAKMRSNADWDVI